ncbi:MAG: hypothetical protein B7X99_20885 [Rhizobiales bacterium 17-65-6]|nr:MAG: hypothetical protein B7X99_20885 [Rhizobiales bacterium 17-65-6]
MTDGRKAAKLVIEKLEQKAQKAAEEEIDFMRMSEAFIRDAIVFLESLDENLRSKSMGSVERSQRVLRDVKVMEVLLKVTVLERRKVLKFGVHRTKIVVGGQRESDQVSPSGPVYSQEQLIDWLSSQITSML